jgi:MATE family multidrug resistance protein
VGKAFGKKQWWKIGVFFQNALLINGSLSVILFLVVYLLKPLLYHLNQPENVVALALPYFDWMIASSIPVLIFFTCRQFAEGVGNTKIAMWVTISGNVINIILNYVLIFGKFGLPALGVEGAGIATFIARTLMALTFVIVVFKHTALKRFTQFFSWKNFHFPAIKQLIATGFPISGQLIVEMLVFSISAIMIGWINEVNLAAHQIMYQLVSATFMIGLGVASACTIHIAHQFGAKHYKATAFTAIAAQHLVTAFYAITAILFIILRYQIPTWFSTDPEVIEVAAQLFIIAAMLQLFDGWQTVGLAILRGLADVTYAMYIAILSYAIVSLPIGYFLGLVWNLGSVGVWIGICLGCVVAAIAYRLRFLVFMRKYCS